MKFIFLLIPIVLTACGSVSPIVSIDQDTYMVGSHGVLGNGSSAAEKAKGIQAATEFCAAKSKTVQVVNIESVDPFWGRAPSADIRFRCVSK